MLLMIGSFKAYVGTPCKYAKLTVAEIDNLRHFGHFPYPMVPDRGGHGQSDAGASKQVNRKTDH